MKKRLFTAFLSISLSLFLSSMAFAEIDLDLGDDSPGGSPMSEGFVTISGTYDMGGSADVSYEIDDFDYDEEDEIDIKSGFALTLELGKAINENIGLGIGATYQFKRGIDEKGADDAEFNFIPIYGMIKFWTDAGEILPFGIVQIGYNLFQGTDDMKTLYYYEADYDYEAGARWKDCDMKGGLYWGIGGGIILQNGVQIQLLYSVNNGSIEGSDYEYYYIGYDGSDYGEESSDIIAEIKYSKISISAGITF